MNIRCSILSLLLLFFGIQNCFSQTIIKEKNTALTYIPDHDLGELFITVQREHIFPDSKTFVDCIPNEDPNQILKKYLKEKNTNSFVLKEFIHQNFTLPLSILPSVIDTNKNMILHLQKHWPNLVRESKSNDQYTTLISLPYPFVVPGGRFREMFYWDSYFTIIGLLESNQDELALNMIRNFAYLVNTYGHIPNGNRTYFLSRSQPPFFSEMLRVYSQKHGVNSIIAFLPALEKEYQYWTADAKNVSQSKIAVNKSVWTNETILNRYSGTLTTPRAEAYDKEYKWSLALKEELRPAFHQNLRAACESGWDFSSRWFADEKNKTTVQCENFIPVCLNSLLYNCEKELAALYQFQSNSKIAKKYEALAESRKKAILKYCWSEKESVFNDYDFVTKRPNSVISLATVYPLFFGIATQQQSNQVAQSIQDKFLMKGGVVTTLNTTGEQWDAPNGWAPLQYMTVIGLARYEHNELAKTIAQRWLALNEKEYLLEGKMMEKYNVMELDQPGGGGNYTNQDGFGWTNGVDLALNSWLLKIETNK